MLSGPPNLVAEGPRVPRLMLVTDARRARMLLLDLAREATAGGVDAIYLRDAGGSIDELARITETLRAQVWARGGLLATTAQAAWPQTPVFHCAT